jgi:uncharacterized protein (TIGR00290 family)
LRRTGREPAALLTTVDEDSGAIAHHGIDRELLRLQAAATGIPLVTVAVPRAAPNTVYEQRLRDAFALAPLSGVEAVAFGDLFLGDLRLYREQRLREAGLAAEFPLWGRDTVALALEFISAGFKATIVSVDRRVLDSSYLGRHFDEDLLASLPADVDPCGENGEFHTFVHGGPVLAEPIIFSIGAVTEGQNHSWLELRANSHA